jgi:hypothetical protein
MHIMSGQPIGCVLCPERTGGYRAAVAVSDCDTVLVLIRSVSVQLLEFGLDRFDEILSPDAGPCLAGCPPVARPFAVAWVKPG